jgi:hypothetical protein
MELFINNNPHNSDLVDLNLIHSMEGIASDSKVPAVKFLEVCFDPSLNFKFQVAITSKLSKALYIMRMVKNYLNSKALYYSLLHCHLNYTIPIWSCCNKKHLTHIHKKQKQAIRITDGLKYNAHTEPSFKKHYILPVLYLIDFFALQLMQ